MGNLVSLQHTISSQLLIWPLRADQRSGTFHKSGYVSILGVNTSPMGSVWPGPTSFIILRLAGSNSCGATQMYWKGERFAFEWKAEVRQVCSVLHWHWCSHSWCFWNDAECFRRKTLTWCDGVHNLVFLFTWTHLRPDVRSLMRNTQPVLARFCNARHWTVSVSTWDSRLLVLVCDWFDQEKTISSFPRHAISSNICQNVCQKVQLWWEGSGKLWWESTVQLRKLGLWFEAFLTRRDAQCHHFKFSKVQWIHGI